MRSGGSATGKTMQQMVDKAREPDGNEIIMLVMICHCCLASTHGRGVEFDSQLLKRHPSDCRRAVLIFPTPGSSRSQIQSAHGQH